MGKASSTSSGSAVRIRPRRRRPMTHWYNPLMLLQTGIRVLISTIFGTFADRREIIAVSNAIAAQPFDDTFDYSSRMADGEFWFDFMADTGDGWDPTFAVARLVTAPSLQLGPHRLPRGQLLILGGDEVYPTPSRQNYEDRFLGPFEEALAADPQSARANMPDLYAMPGNHDWYDGLSAFVSLFCRRRIATPQVAGISRPGREIAGRRTYQTRSYFALKLPQGWWLWGTDSQIDGYLDQPQVDFFQYVASSWMDRGSKLILCSGQPSWTYVDARKPGAKFTTFSYLERLAALAKDSTNEPMGHQLKLVLTGDTHHYSRYTEDGTVQYVTAGGGGAFLHPTHHLTDRRFAWDYPPPNRGPQQQGTYQRAFTIERKASGGEALFPDRATSRKLSARNVAFAFLNPGMLLFFWIAYALYFWSLEASSIIAVGQPLGSYAGQHSDFGAALMAQLAVGFATPWPALLFLLSLAIYVYFADEPYSWPRRLGIGLAHGLLQSAVVVALSCASFWIGARGEWASVWIREVAPIIVGSLAAAMVSATLFGLYLWFCLNVLGVHWNEAFSALRSPHFKNFLRLRIAADGSLHLYPVGLADVPRTTRRGAATSLQPSLIEDPVVIR